MSDTEIKTALQQLQNNALSRGDHKLLLRAAGVSRDWARGFLPSAHVTRFLRRVTERPNGDQ